MKITKISQQLKRPSRYSVFIDGKFAFSLSDSELLSQKLFSGQLIDRPRLLALKKLSADDKAYSSALHYISLRPRSKWEMEQYLFRKQVSNTVSLKILNKLSRAHLLDDQAFAQAWIESRQLLKPSSTRRLILELKQKHIDEQIIENILNGQPIDNQATIQQLIAKKHRQSKYKNDKIKLMQYLARQGFDYVDIKAALAESTD